jgi:hypothetical protein
VKAARATGEVGPGRQESPSRLVRWIAAAERSLPASCHVTSLRLGSHNDDKTKCEHTVIHASEYRIFDTITLEFLKYFLTRKTYENPPIHRLSNVDLNSHYVTFEVFTAVTMKNAAFWDIETQFVLHRKHIISPLQSPAS